MTKKMKDSGIPWIGEIPENWEVCKVKNISNFINGYAFSSNEINVNGLYKVIRIGDISNNIDFDKCLSISKNENLQNYKINLNDILIAMSGATAGKIGLIQTNNVAYINQRVGIIRSPFYKYLYYYMQSDMFLDYVKLFSASSAQPNISCEQIGNYNISLNQNVIKKIVEILDKKCGQIDDLVSLEENEIEKLKEYKTSLITKVVTKGLDPNAKMKDSGIPWIGQIPYDWEVKRLKYIADILLKGNGITKDDVVGEGNTPCVRYGDIYTTYEFKFNECKTRTNKEKFSNLQYFTHGDILFTTTGELVEEIGKSVVYMGNKECLAGGDVVIMKHSQEPVFLGYALESSYVREQKSFGKLKLKVVHISIQDISNLYVALPTKNEQVIIGKYLDEKCEEIDNLIKIKQEKIEKMKEYKKSLIYQYVTGKKEVV